MVQRSLLHGLVACVFAFSGLTASSALADDMTEYGVKASFISGIIKFITPISKQPKIEVCVLGDNPILDTADAVRDINLVKETKLNNISSHCHAVFIGAAEGEEYKDALAMLKGKPVLTFGDSPDFIERGGMIMLAPQNGKIKPVINKRAIERVKLSADPLMLESSVFKVIDD